MDISSRPKIDLEQLDRLLSGESSPLESREQAIVQVAREAAGIPQADIDTRWAGVVVGALREAPSVGSERSLGGSRTASTTSGRTNSYLWRYISVAAFIILSIAGIKYFPATTQTSESKTYTTSPRQIAKITLPSGAQVTLAPSTQLSVTENDITLNGQAVFTVLHNNGKPFIVKTSQATVRVLGTTFSVRSYDGASTRVVVAEGKVSANNTVLSVGDAADVTRSGTSVQHAADLAGALAWTEGRLVFDDVPFKETITELERWYGVTIEVRDSALLNRRIVTTLTSETPSQAFALIARAMDARAKIIGNKVVFTNP